MSSLLAKHADQEGRHRTFYGDFHIHIGATSAGQPVKISGSRNLTFEAIAHEASERKGLDLIGIIDCHAPGVLRDILMLLNSGEMIELKGGGIQYGRTSVMLGVELELKESGYGPAHVLCYMPTFDAMHHFSSWISQYVRNMSLSTQRIYVSWKTLQEETAARGGLFIPAHVFTPHKSVYGSCTDHMQEIADMTLIDGIELGLSADTKMASRLTELDLYPFLSNSDAHSLAKIAREYNALRMPEPTFEQWANALRGQAGCHIEANYGLNPLLGKYHKTTCVNGHLLADAEQRTCPECGSTRRVAGVADRIASIADRSEAEATAMTALRPPYIHQVPLEHIPGVGPKMLNKLLDHAGTEMNILHHTTEKELTDIAGDVLAERIVRAREGKLSVNSGGGGIYGKVVDS